jgi:formylmethanofuran dehydrogenase subunit C
MTLRLKYKAETTVPVEVEGLVPSSVRAKLLAQIERLEVFHGNRKLALAEVFDVTGDPTDQRIEFEGDLSGVHWIGAGMDGGQIHVAGSAGRHVGSEMSAGRITVDGDAGDWVGAQMHGGVIRVRGRAGHAAGAAYRGSARGMTGGTILIDGPAGNEIGHTMRRGVIAVGGAGDAVGVGMIAGSVYVFGTCGIRPGAEMRRGTIGLFGPDGPELLPTFRCGCRYRPLFLRVHFAELRRLGYAVNDELLACEVDLYHGDLVATGRGEILVARRSA